MGCNQPVSSDSESEEDALQKYLIDNDSKVLNGVVQDAEGNAVAGSSVYLRGDHFSPVVTNREGKFSLKASRRVLAFSADSLTLIAFHKANGTELASLVVDIPAASAGDTEYTLILGPTGAVKGELQILREGASYSENANIYIPGTHYKALLLAGKFQINGIPPGTYELKIDYDDLKDQVLGKITVEPNAQFLISKKIEMPAEFTSESITISELVPGQENLEIEASDSDNSLEDAVSVDNELVISTPKLVGNSLTITANSSLQCLIEQETYSSQYPNATLKFVVYNGETIRQETEQPISDFTVVYQFQFQGETGPVDQVEEGFKCSVQVLNEGSALTDPQFSEVISIENAKPLINLKAGQQSAKDVASGVEIDTLNLEATDADGDSITFKKLNPDVCPTITLNAETGAITGVFPEALPSSEAQICAMEFVAIDSYGVLSDTITITLKTSNSSPQLTCTSTQLIGSIGSSRSVQCSGSDPDVGTVLTYSVEGNCENDLIDTTGKWTISEIPAATCTALVRVSDGATSVSESIEVVPDVLLVWDGSPTLDKECKLEFPGTVTFPGGGTYSSAGTTSSEKAASFLGSQTGASGFLSDYTTGNFDSKWEVVSSNTFKHSLTKTLELTETSITTASSNLQAMLGGQSQRYMTAEGQQLPFEGGCQKCSSAGARAFISIGGGYDGTTYAGHACTFYEGDKEISCWGHQSYGQLGNGNITGPSGGGVAHPAGTGVSAGHVSAGNWHTCAVDRSGDVYCWGRDNEGQLGNGSGSSADVSSPTKIPTLGNILSVASGGKHSCALDTSGGAYCWGRNDEGQLGNGNQTDQHAPVEVLGIPDAIRSIHAGGDTTCAITRTERVYCWGDNTDDQILDTSSGENDTPVEITSSLGSNVAQIEPGESFTCVLYENKIVNCWGSGGAGQLGNGANSNSVSPQVVDFGAFSSGPVGLSVGAHHACAILDALI